MTLLGKVTSDNIPDGYGSGFDFNTTDFFALIGIIALIALIIFLFYILVKKLILTNEKAASPFCQCCGKKSAGYDLCKECFDKFQNGDICKCKNCNGYYYKENICSCIKHN